MMFYCEECREMNQWPDSLMGVFNVCELCGRATACWEQPSSSLPIPKPKRRIKLNEGGWYRVLITDWSEVYASLKCRDCRYGPLLEPLGRMFVLETEFEELARAYCQKEEKGVGW
jgi:hypothetical protein